MDSIEEHTVAAKVYRSPDSSKIFYLMMKDKINLWFIFYLAAKESRKNSIEISG